MARNLTPAEREEVLRVRSEQGPEAATALSKKIRGIEGQPVNLIDTLMQAPKPIQQSQTSPVSETPQAKQVEPPVEEDLFEKEETE